MGSSTPVQKREELRRAVVDLGERGLITAARWAAEQLMGLPKPGAVSLLDAAAVATRGPSSAAGQGVPSTSGQAQEPDEYLLAKCYFDMKEYRRAAQLLKAIKGSKAQFLRCFSIYLAGEKRKEEERVEVAGVLGKSEVPNRELEALQAELKAAQATGTADAFCLYLLGVVLADREQAVQARAALLASLSAYPCNWAAWQALQGLCGEREALAGVELPRHWMRDCFLAALCLELQHNQEGLSRLQALSEMFPDSDWVLWQAATAQYNLRNFDEAQELFQDLLHRDPFRVEGVDTYSNILYVKEQFAELSHLAHRAAQTDKYRPETCCIIGNYYSLKSQHEKAVMYFRRALKLNRHYLSAWTLMGHEYVEMKNPPAAIEAYRRAVDLNPRDYRAWYGLGQTYELLHMPYYALYYFRRATQLRPADARMWCAMGQCYEHQQLGLDEAAIRCYRRALHNNDREGIALHKLAQLHETRGEKEEAAHYYRLNLDRIDNDNISGTDAIEALTFLAQYTLDLGMLADAEGYSMRLLDYGSQAKEWAKSLLLEVRSKQQDLQQHRQQRSTAAAGYMTPLQPLDVPHDGSSSDIEPDS